MLSSSLRRMNEEHEGFDPVVRMAPFGALRSMLENGLVDVLLESRDPHGEPDGASVFRRMLDCPSVCVCSPENPLAGRDRVGLDELADGGRLAVGDPHHCAAATVEIQRAAASHMPPERVMMAYNIEVALALASAGVAFTVQAGIPAREVPLLRYIPIEGLPVVTLGVRVRRGRRTAVLDHFLEVLAEQLRRTPELR